MKKLNTIKMKKTFFLFETFCENHPPIRHIKYKVINFALSKTSIQPIRKDFLCGLNLRLRVNSAKYIAR